jgi:hypothetical protein
MNPQILRELSDKGLIKPEQYARLEPILAGRVLSLYYELRLGLYLGILLFTTGVGILIYLNIGELGHRISIFALSILMFLCFAYAFYKTPSYSNDRHPVPTPYFDYVLLLGCLLFISVLGYLQFQYALFDERIELTTLLSAVLFFFAAYRFDHLGILSLGITALGSYWGLSMSPKEWYAGGGFEGNRLPFVAMGYGLLLFGAATVLNYKSIKKHFTFTYLNFASLLFLMGSLAKVLDEDFYLPYLALLQAACIGLAYYGLKKRWFLFILYSYVAGYIGITYFLGDTIFQNEPSLWFMYFLLSCGGLIVLIIRYRNLFKRPV